MSRQPALHPTPSTRHRFHVLDALRGVAAILVVFWHTSVGRFFPTYSNFRAVDFFFCLSGFVLAFSYEKRLRANLDARQFLTARLIRLYPVYLLATVAGLLLAFHRPVLGMHSWFTSALLPFFGFQVFLLPGLLTHSGWLFSLDFPAWSIFFELIANVAYVLLVRSGRARTGHLIALVLASLCVLLLWCAHGGTVDAGAFRRPSVVLGVPRVMLSFFAGVLSFRCFQARDTGHWSPGTSTAAAAFIGVVLVLLLLSPFPVLRSRGVSLFTFLFLFPALVYLGAHCRLPSAWAPLCSFLGDTSYPFYLLHAHFLPLLLLPFTTRLLLLHPALMPCAVPCIIVLTGMLSAVVLHVFDVPVRRWLVARYNGSVALGPTTTKTQHNPRTRPQHTARPRFTGGQN